MLKESSIVKKLHELSKRVARLERLLILGRPSESASDPVGRAPSGFRGSTGGVRLLIKDGVFRQKCQLSDVVAALTKRGYHYSRQAVHESLRRLSSTHGPLVSLKEKGRKVYVERR
ncbi:hypothetical protein DRH29_00060 [candidate division Kazan bacterium]|uniref:HTH HARE-type domain-containing protein n=1 Tax=candidate division Kazan bacterium TaxID=2202143 RepID=A0A420ZDF8_UNCK3|nr:MAG: hypothetical protein DRH29_00060 [candidate division Kazan bacterium]